MSAETKRPPRFPNPREAGPEGLLAVGGELNLASLKEAYAHGIFPWPHPEHPLLWFSPDPRGILDFKDFHVPDSLHRHAKRHPHWRFTHNQAFPQVIRACAAQPRPGQNGTWIEEDMIKAYEDFFAAGFVHSIEAWEEDELVGGIYGVDIRQTFSGESMFFRRPNASKMCLWRLVKMLQEWGREWMDIQMVTPVTAQMGGKYIPRDEYLKRLESNPWSNVQSDVDPG